MAKIRFKCTCGRSLSVDEEHAGKIAKCPACNRPVRVPAPEGADLPAEAAPQDMAEKVSSLSRAYGEAMLTRARRERTAEALTAYAKKARKRYLIGAAVAAGLVLIGAVGYVMFQEYGPPLGSPDSYPPAARPFLTFLKEEDPRVRAAAAWEIAEACGGDVLALLGEVARDKHSPLVRLVTVRLLARIKQAGALEYVRPFLMDPDRDVRMAAAFLLAEREGGTVTPDSAAPHVIAALEPGGKWARWYQDVQDSETSADEVETRLAEEMTSEDPGTRAMAAWMAAATLEPDRAARFLRDRLRDEDPGVVVSILHALAPFLSARAFKEIDRREEPEGLLRLRTSVLKHVALRLRLKGRGVDQTARDPRVRVAAALALADTGQTRQAHLVAYGLGDGDWFVRFVTLKGLASMEPRAAVRAVDMPGREVSYPENEWTRRVLTRLRQAAQQAGPEDGASDDEPAAPGDTETDEGF